MAARAGMTVSDLLPADWSAQPWQLVMAADLYGSLQRHLFPGDNDEHAAVIAAGYVQTDRGTRLLARELFLAEDGVDFIPSRRAYKQLAAGFVNEKIRFCRDQGLVYLAVHNHGGDNAVAFSSPDLVSHQRGYPALLDIARGLPVGALVLAKNALAGDIWTHDGHRRVIAETVVIDRNLTRLYPAPQAAPPERTDIDDRQARVYGDAGQAILGRLKVGVIGAGGVGLPVVAALARLGVGHLIVIDPERVEPSNLPRLPETTRLDAMTWLANQRRAAVLRGMGTRLSAPKVRVARRIARRARKGIVVDALRTDVSDSKAARRLVDCDYLFLAADSHQARAVFNALVHQYLIPGVQIGSRVEVDPDSGSVGQIFSVVRPVTPNRGCMWCNGLINPAKLTEEGVGSRDAAGDGYLDVDDAPAPAVMTLNALGVAAAVNDFMLTITGLVLPRETADDYRRHEVRTGSRSSELPRSADDCFDCSTAPHSVRARGDRARLPLRA